MSSIRWEMKMRDTPLSRRPSAMRYRSSLSRTVSAAVGSSMMMIRALVDRALAISTICCWATERLPIVARGSKSASSRCRSSRALRCRSLQSILRVKRLTFSWPIKMFSVTDSVG